MELITISGGRVLHLVRIEAYMRKDGRPSSVAVWRATCKTCGAAYEIATPSDLAAVTSSKAFTTVNCPLHRKRRGP